jgi:uncharacterized protein YhdP
MGRRTLRVAAWTAAASLLLAVVGAALLLHRIQRAPIPLAFLVPSIERALGDDGDVAVRLGGLELAWDGRRRRLELHAHDVRVARGADGATVTLDAIALRLRKRALLEGRLAVTAIELYGPRLELSRRADGSTVLRTGGEGGAREAGDVGLLGSVLENLETIGVRDGSAVLVDEVTRTRWIVPDFEANVWRDGGSVRVQAEATVVVGESRLPVWAEAVFRPNGMIDVQATTPGGPTAEALRYWPAELASEARTWVVRHVTGGRVRDVALGLRLQRGAGDESSLVLDTLEASLAYEDLTVRYADPMQPVDGVRGTARFHAAGADFAVEHGTLQALTVGPATVRIAWPRDEPNRIAVDARVEGPLASALEVLDDEPIALGREMGFEPIGVQGTTTAHVHVGFPLSGRHRPGNLGLAVTATVRDVAIASIAGDWDIADGAATVSASDQTFSLDGTAAIRGVPATIRWESRAGDVGGGRIEIAARLDEAQRAALGVAAGGQVAGPIDTVVRIGRDAEGREVADVDADLAPATLDVPVLAVRKAPGESGRAAAHLVLRRGVVGEVESADLVVGGTTVHATASRPPGGGDWSRADVEAVLPTPGEDGAAAGFTMALRADGDAWHVGMTSPNLGLLFRAYGIDTVRGGTLDFDGTVDPRGSEIAWSGRATAERFTVTRVSWLVRVIEFASVRGMFKPSGGAAPIDRMVATLVGRPDAVEVTDAVAKGPTLAVTVRGAVGHPSGVLDLEGTVAPSYFLLNEGMDRLPVIGGLLSRATGGAVQAITFTVRGPRDDPSIVVQPLSSIAPGVLREWVRKLGL